MILQGLGDGNIVLRAYPEWRKQLVGRIITQLKIIKYLNSQITVMEKLESRSE